MTDDQPLPASMLQPVDIHFGPESEPLTPPPGDLRQRYAEALAATCRVHQLFENGCTACDQRLAAVLGVRAEEMTALRQEVERLREECDQVGAHDRQPYPTQWAYDQACAALEKHRQRAARAEVWVASLLTDIRTALASLQTGDMHAAIALLERVVDAAKDAPKPALDEPETHHG